MRESDPSAWAAYREARNAYHREYHKKWYAKNGGKLKLIRARRHASENVVKRGMVLEAKQCGCIVCGESEPACIDLHHLDPKTKKFPIGNAGSGHSIGAVEREIAKCVPICANCHRKHHVGLLALPVPQRQA